MKARFAHSLFLVVLPCLCGCPGGSSESKAATKASEPLEGKAPTKASQFVGTWLALGEGELGGEGNFAGIEFTKDGKALLSDGTGGGLTLDYSVLEGGRLSLMIQGGMTVIYDAKLAGDQMELTGQASMFGPGGTQRFRRLKSGETIAEAKRKENEARAAAWNARVAAVNAVLAQKDLVLQYTETGPDAPGSIALEIQHSGSTFTGKAWHDDVPPHLNEISGQVSADPYAQSVQVLVAFGPRISPPAARPDGGGQIAMQATGEGKDLRIACMVTFGGDTTSHELVLRPDAKLHREIVGRYDAEIARIEGLKQPLIGALKDYAVLRGQVQSIDPRKNGPDLIDLELTRDPGSGNYRCEGVAFTGLLERGEAVPLGAAAIVVANDQAMLRIVCSGSSEYLVGLRDAAGKELGGTCQTAGYQQRNAHFEIVRALDARARDAAFEARRKELKALVADAVFTGLAFEDSGFGYQMPIPIRLKTSVDADGRITGEASYPPMATRMSVAGQIEESGVGPRLRLNHAAALATPGDQIFLRSIQSGSWTLRPAEGGLPGLTGEFSGPPVRRTTLTRSSRASVDHLHERLTRELADGEAFLVGKWMQGQELEVFQLQVKMGTDDIEGRFLTGGRSVGANLDTTFVGRITDEDGFTIVDLRQRTAAGAREFLAQLRLTVLEDGEGALHLCGINYKVGEDGKTDLSSPVGQLPHLVPVSTVDAQTRGAIDAALAEAAKARAEKLAKLTPFVPCLQSEHGALQPTPAGRELGLLFLGASVDEDRATITGRGLYLGELPMREFTYTGTLHPNGALIVTTSLWANPYYFVTPGPLHLDDGHRGGIDALTAEDRGKLDRLIETSGRLVSVTPMTLTAEVLDPATAKTREATLQGLDIPGICVFRNAKNDAVAAMFTTTSNGRYQWANEPVTMRLAEPIHGSALYLKNGGAPTAGLTVVLNGIHKVTLPVIDKLGAAIVRLPQDLAVIEIRLDAGPAAYLRGVMLLE